MKTLKLNDLKYSTKIFKDYKYRAKVKFDIIDGETAELDIYTTDENRQNVEQVLLDRRTKKVITLNIFHWASKKQDDKATALVNEWLNEA